MTWALTAISLAGVVCNVRRMRICFALWLFSNGGWCLLDLRNENYPRAVLMGVYFVMSVWGLWSWRQKEDVTRA